MTPAQAWLIEPLILLALLGVGLTLISVFRAPRALRWFDRQPPYVLGLVLTGMSAAMGLFVWWLWPAS